MKMTDQLKPVADLLHALAQEFAKEGRAGGDLAAAELRNADIGAFRPSELRSDPSAPLAAASELPDALPMSKLVAQSAPLFEWTPWEGKGLHSQISQNLHTTELLGPDGHITCETVRVGLLVSDAHTDYPVSSHSGEESYLVIAGTAAWTVGGADYALKRPGEIVHHPAWCPHGRRTGEEPFIGAWRWSGDLDLSTFSVV